eukprot:3941936-Rhodomonas_salina.3
MWCYERAVQCPVLAERLVVSFAIGLCARYTVPGTVVVYGAMRVLCDASEEAEATEEVRRGFDADAAQSHSTKCEIVLSKAARDPLPVPRTQSRDPLPVT